MRALNAKTENKTTASKAAANLQRSDNSKNDIHFSQDLLLKKEEESENQEQKINSWYGSNFMSGSAEDSNDNRNNSLPKTLTNIQTKLEISAPGDKYEQETDRVADQVMRMPEPVMQRQIEEEEEPVQMKSFIQRQVEEEEEPIQTKPLSSEITPWVQRQIEAEEKEE